MKNHTLKIENLPILTEELSNDELASVKGGQFLTFELFPAMGGTFFNLEIPLLSISVMV